MIPAFFASLALGFSLLANTYCETIAFPPDSTNINGLAPTLKFSVWYQQQNNQCVDYPNSVDIDAKWKTARAFSIIAPVIVVICAVGAYTVHNSLQDVVLMLVFGLMGYAFKKLKYPMAPLVLALVLGDMAETSFRQSMLISKGSLDIFVSTPLAGTITCLALVMLLWPALGFLKKLSRG